MSDQTRVLRAGAALGAVIALLAGGCAAPRAAVEDTPTPLPTQEQAVAPTPAPVDVTAPVIEGARDLVTPVGMTVTYRSGVTATDDTDPRVTLQVDASAVDLNTPGDYPVIYTAADSKGNRSQVQVTLTVVEVAGVDDDDPTKDVTGELVPEDPVGEVTREMVDEEADKVLARIVNDAMSAQEKARAIYTYVNTRIKYVGRSDKTNWMVGAYVGFTRGRGDCYNYFACAKALLTRAGIPNIDLYRVGGGTDHYWQLVNVGWGWYHFDACPHPDSCKLTCFLLDEMQVRAYTQRCARIRTNYYVYDYAACPVVPAGFPPEEYPLLTAAQPELDPNALPSETPLPSSDPLPEGEQPSGSDDEPVAPPEAVGAPGSLTPGQQELPSAGPEPTSTPQNEETPAEPIQEEPASPDAV